MNRVQVATLLTSLAERVRSNATSGALTVKISSSEKQAIETAAAYLTGDEIEIPAHYELDLTCTRLTKPKSPDILLCLDFGTATSKAFARRVTNDDLMPLSIGGRAGQTEPLFALVSSMYITPGGKVLFGQNAVSNSRADHAYGHRRIDSIKDFLAKGDTNLALGEALLDRTFNPSGVRLREIDVLVLYLGYLTDMATTELAEVYGVSRYVRRRFSLPVFDLVRAEWANRHLRDAMAKAQILADTFHGKWSSGIELTEAKAALDSLRKVAAPAVFVEPIGVTEPIAAIASRTRGTAESGNKRQLLAVIDVGAGTIDFALFYRMPGKNGSGLFQLIPGTEKVLRQAGNQVDTELKTYIFKRAGVRQSQSDFGLINAAISLDLRSFKESLFLGEGSETYKLVNDKKIRVVRDEFLSSTGILQLERQIHAKFEEMLRGADRSWITGMALVELVALITGGGADLPFVRSLENRTFQVGRPITVRIGTPRPKYIENDFPALSLEYPRLAVALGGSSKELPATAPKQFSALGATQDTYVPDVVRKGS
jgi:hypothetical protein